MIADKLRIEFRQKRLGMGYSLRAISKVVGVSFATLSRFERGETPSLLTFEFINKFVTGKTKNPKPEKLGVLKQISMMNARLKRIEIYLFNKKTGKTVCDGWELR